MEIKKGDVYYTQSSQFIALADKNTKEPGPIMSLMTWTKIGGGYLTNQPEYNISKVIGIGAHPDNPDQSLFNADFDTAITAIPKPYLEVGDTFYTRFGTYVVIHPESEKEPAVAECTWLNPVHKNSDHYEGEHISKRLKDYPDFGKHPKEEAPVKIDKWEGVLVEEEKGVLVEEEKEEKIILSAVPEERFKEEAKKNIFVEGSIVWDGEQKLKVHYFIDGTMFMTNDKYLAIFGDVVPLEQYTDQDIPKIQFGVKDRVLKTDEGIIVITVGEENEKQFKATHFGGIAPIWIIKKKYNFTDITDKAADLLNTIKTL
jgi:hypothetical protein